MMSNKVIPKRIKVKIKVKGRQRRKLKVRMMILILTLINSHNPQDPNKKAMLRKSNRKIKEIKKCFNFI